MEERLLESLKLLDTNIIVYAVGRPHAYKHSCGQLLQEVVRGDGGLNADTELFQEILYLYSARGERPRALSTCADLLVMFPDPLPIGREEILLAHQLLNDYPDLVPRDAIHAAVVLANHLEGIVTTDKVFDTITNITRFDPLALYPEDD